jgi:hypothetical protein
MAWQCKQQQEQEQDAEQGVVPMTSRIQGQDSELGQTGLAQPKTKDIVWYIRRELTNHTAQKGTGRLAKLVLGGQNGLPYETKDASRGERPSNLVEIAPIDHHQSIISTYWPTHAMDFRGPSTINQSAGPHSIELPRAPLLRCRPTL